MLPESSVRSHFQLAGPQGSSRSVGSSGSPSPHPAGPRESLAGFRPGRFDLMQATIPTYSLYGMDAVPADVTVGGNSVVVIERHTRRSLREVRWGPDSCRLASVQSDGSTLVRRDSAPETMTTGQGCPFHLATPI